MIKLRALLLRTRSSMHSAEGFTMTEVLASVAISIVLSVAVTAIILSTLNLVTDAELAAGTGAKAQKVLTSFTATAREASKISAASQTVLTFSYRAKSSCELHTYRFEGDPTNVGRLRLHHQVTAVSLPTGAKCSAVDALLLGGTLSVTADRYEIDDLASTSRFTYYATTGQQVFVPGDPGYSVSSTTAPCLLGSVAMNLDVRNVGRNSTTTTSEVGYAAFRNNTRGLGCSTF